MALASLFAAAEPALSVRGVHLDLKGCPPTFARLLELIRLLAALRYNAVLIEWEDMFPWKLDERFRSLTCYSAQEAATFHQAAAEAGIEVIPLVQCLGHMETPLGVPGYEALREVAGQSDVLNPLAKGARELVQRMVEEIVAATPGIRHLHLGGDEAWSFGTHPDTKAFIEKHSKGALYLHHIEPILDWLNAQSIRPILWHDMMVQWDSAALEKLARKADLMVWGYHGHPDQTPHHYNSKHIQRFKEHGVGLWGGTAYKGPDGMSVDLPVVENRRTSALAWVEVAQRYSMKGVITTAWSRSSTGRVQKAPIDGALDMLVEQAVILHDGALPAGGDAACLSALEQLGERQRFESCRDALGKMTRSRGWGWEAVRDLRQQIVLMTLDPRRRGSGAEWRLLRDLRRHVAGAVEAGEKMLQAFAGLMQELWVHRYIAERVEPLREELSLLEPRLRQIDPVGYEAAGKAMAP